MQLHALFGCSYRRTITPIHAPRTCTVVAPVSAPAGPLRRALDGRRRSRPAFRGAWWSRRQGGADGRSDGEEGAGTGPAVGVGEGALDAHRRAHPDPGASAPLINGTPRRFAVGGVSSLIAS